MQRVAGIQCNCPDSVNKRSQLNGSPYLSELFPSDWSNNFSGIRNRGGYCKHEIAVILYRGEQDKYFPNGVPVEMPIDSSLIKTAKQKQIFDSDNTYV